VVRRAPVHEMPMVPPRVHVLRVVDVVLPRNMDCAALERAQERQHQRERNGEQQYE
jgi:hypothetical protein